ncbi:MAG TPA: CRISPR-associated protein Cas4 [Spirochaetota bacterium]|nr:CRISPR-associated protein Cas4 [Spirochaetota bacterium]HOR92487.1 CRISPR-associated protein Cas4 [Spirochaetota bacterium]HOT20666.1 CRISPR-associated protein Cas4 [Spirochaetota bacterium]HPK45159.1 CRISPR-associated protein Cas4 [Spirochaetota bacterium]HQG43942.1 CRISPR-associated protein Cas4 [Spirochaetota bacterium]
MYNNITPVITGTQIAYYIVCHRKLWLFNKNISLEHTSELVEIGNLIHEASYTRKRKEINLEGIKIDLLEAKRGIIHEVKKSKALEESHAWQLKYYIYYCKQIGIEVEGIIDYPKLRRREKIILNMEDEEKIKNILNEIYVIMSDDKLPAVIKKPYCKKCSYYEFCYC